MVVAAEAEFGKLDILVNNAGIQFVSPVQDFPAAKWDAIIAINLSSNFHAIAAALPGMLKRDHGRIINVASAHGLVASPYKTAYVAAKHGVVGLTKSVALEIAQAHVTCNAICPGFVRTPLAEAQVGKLEAAARERVAQLRETERAALQDEIEHLLGELLARDALGYALRTEAHLVEHTLERGLDAAARVVLRAAERIAKHTLEELSVGLRERRAVGFLVRVAEVPRHAHHVHRRQGPNDRASEERAQPGDHVDREAWPLRIDTRLL